MHKFWKKKSQEEIKERIFSALKKNVDYRNQNILGIPASYLDEKVFSQDVSFLKDAPFITTLLQNPNHIGCHTLGKSESFFKGTQEIEKELIEICAVDILKANTNEVDGYVASGGTEANLQAIWIYRNYFIQELKAKREEISIICSEDSHYSMAKAANVFALDILKIKVHQENRQVEQEDLENKLNSAVKQGKKHFIVICNMMTTMFGSIDDVDVYSHILKKMNLSFKIHIDGAYGGFYYPFSQKNSQLTFENKYIHSFTLDAHKMAQAPYGTGIFLIRKNWIQYANTQEASYVEGEDFTLIGSRSGANAVAVWMILMKNGPFGWQEKIFILQKRTDWICEQLNQLKTDYYRNPFSNIITIKSKFIKPEIAKKYGLVPDNHQNPTWYKIVLMEHVTIEKLIPLLDDIKTTD